MRYTARGWITTPCTTPAEIRAKRAEEDKISRENKHFGEESIDEFLRRMDYLEARAALAAAKAPQTQQKTTTRRRKKQHQSHGAAGKRPQADGDGPSSDPEPERPPSHQHQFYRYASAAQFLDCSVQTLRNKVSLGLIPPPISTRIGPRFTSDQILQISQQIIPNPPPRAPRGRGRPRIAQRSAGGGS